MDRWRMPLMMDDTVLETVNFTVVPPGTTASLVMPGNGERIRLVASSQMKGATTINSQSNIGVQINGAFFILATLSPGFTTFVLKYEEIGNILCQPIYATCDAGQSNLYLCDMRARPRGEY